MKLRLLVICGTELGKAFPLVPGETLLIGRGEECGIQLMDACISRMHCQVVVEGGHALIEDLNSRWGTVVNGEKVGRRALAPQDVVTLGQTELRFEITADTVAPTWEQPVSSIPLEVIVPKTAPPKPEEPLMVVPVAEIVLPTVAPKPKVQVLPVAEIVTESAKPVRSARIEERPKDRRPAPRTATEPPRRKGRWPLLLAKIGGLAMLGLLLLVLAALGLDNNPKTSEESSDTIAATDSQNDADSTPSVSLSDALRNTIPVAPTPEELAAAKTREPANVPKAEPIVPASKPPEQQVAAATSLKEPTKPIAVNPPQNSLPPEKILPDKPVPIVEPKPSVEPKVVFQPKSAPPPQNPTLVQATTYRREGKFPEAVAEFAALLKAEEDNAGDPEKILSLKRQLAEAYRGNGEFSKAEPLFKACYEASEPTIDAMTKAVPQDMRELAYTQSSSGNDSKALTTLADAMISRGGKFGEFHPAIADVYFALGELHATRQEWPEAIDYLQSCLRIRREVDGNEGESLIRPLIVLGGCLFEANQSNRAEPELMAALKVAQKHYPSDHPQVAEAECRLARFYGDTGRPNEGGALIRSSETKILKYPNDESFSAIYVRTEVANVMNLIGQYERGRSMGLETLDMARRTFGLRDYRLCEVLSVVALSHVRLGRTKEAGEHFAQYMDITVDRFGENAWQCAMAYGSRAVSHFTQKREVEAERDYLRAVELFESCPTGTPPSAFATYQNLATLYRHQTRWDESAKWFSQSARSSRVNLFSQIPVLPDESKFIYASVVMSSVGRPFSDAVHHRDIPELASASAEWVINLKGFVVEVLSQRSNLSRDEKDPKVRKLLVEMTRIRQQLASSSVSLVKRKTPEQIQSLKNREREISTQLGEQTRSNLNSEAWVTLDEVRGLLDKDEVVVEFLKFQYSPPIAGAVPADHYAAWIIPPLGEGDVELQLIGPSAPLDQVIKLYNRTLESTSTLAVLAGEASGERRLDTVGLQLSQVLIERFPTLKRFPRWRISPDGALWLVPWAALKTSDGKYVVEGYEVSYLVTSRQLTWKDEVQRTKTRPIIVANPDYNAGVKGVSVDLLFSKLPGTAKEAEAVAPSLKKFADIDPFVIQGAYASEARVKKIQNPKVLMLSTHGFFDELNRNLSGTAVERNPLLRCGLAFASANGAILSKKQTGEDGILTGLEVTNLDLRGTELVVLSACQTALGDAHRGEGVSGLRQAFQMAGAKSVVATLWSIPDAETVDVTDKLFQELAAGHSDAKALQLAQQSVINARRLKKGAAHPVFWGAFCVTRTGK